MKKLLLLLLAVPAFAATTITFPNAGVYFSPYGWRPSGGAEICPLGGCYLKTIITTGSGCGTSCVLTVNADTSINNSLSTPDDYPAIKWHCDTATVPGVWAWAQFPNNNSASTPVALTSSLSASTAYTCYLHMGGGNTNDGNGWTGTAFQTKINSLTLDTGATVALPTILPNTCLFQGASYEQGYFGQTATGPYFTWDDPEQTWAQGLAQQTVLNCEWGLIGIGAQGFQNPGQGGYPVFGSSWDHYDSTHIRSFSSPPQFFIVHQAENDTAYSAVTEAAIVSAWIGSARSTLGSTTKIFMIGGQSLNSATINAGVQNGVTASGDAQTFYVPWGTQWGLTVRGGCTPSVLSSWASSDCLHITAVYQNQFFGDTLTAFIMKKLYQMQYQPTHVILGSMGGWPEPPTWWMCGASVFLVGLIFRRVNR